ncbi:MAG: type II toxin-antitoxin system RelE/ParE family toxin [Candidatus Marinimicrobia bacterium]|nr:type II toxin-antitoxin system RelE/ParE family toxin [Candidatus Neomarinimicrobiota bacterium]MDP7026511.1 type II toxin-antitoxin system RelE/ParE family toxin [Candidatus Neomarinimicrobiota bacterium]
MNNRPYEIFEGIFYKLLAKCKSVTPKHKFRFKNPIYTLDSTSGLFKIRTPKIGKGKRGGIRTFLVYKESKKAIFVYGFSKNKKDNLDKNELKYFKKLAKDLLAIENSEYERLISLGNFKEIEEK